MRLVMSGGPCDGQDVPFPALLSTPAYICTGAREPYQHYLRMEPGGVAYRFAGECAEFEHAHGYPHEHEEDECEAPTPPA